MQRSLPATFKAQTVASKAQTVASVESTDILVPSGGCEPVVILLHGNAEISDSWAPLAAELVKSYTVVVPELRGIGYTRLARMGSL
jgi:pimeloyl-ACP methyl ester carboxylesterase